MNKKSAWVGVGWTTVRNSAAVLVGLVSCFISANSALSATATWTGSSGNGYWNDNGNWTAAYPNGVSDIATFSNAASPTISLNGMDTTVKQIVFDKAIGSCTFNAGGAEKILLPTTSGSIQLLGTTTGTGLIETFNCGISLGANFPFQNARLDTASGLIFNGAITNSTTCTLSFTGAGTGTNRITGSISDGGGIQSITAGHSAGAWELSGANTFSGPLVLSGGGMLVLSGSNTSSGSTTNSNGTLVLAGSVNGGLARGSLTMSGTASLRASDATLRTMSNPLNLSGAALKFGDTVASQLANLIFTNTVTLVGDTTIMVQSADASQAGALVLSGVIDDGGLGRSLVLGGGATTVYGSLFLLGPNTFSGQTKFGTAPGLTGSLVINSIGNAGETSSSLGAPTGGNRTILINAGIGGTSSGGILRYIGGATSTDRTIDMAGTSVNVYGTLDSSGYGPIEFKSVSASAASGGATTRILYLSGINTGANTVSGAIPMGYNGNMKLQKDGAGTWALSAANAFTNGLIVNNGKLILDYASNPTVVAVNNPLTLGGGTLQVKGKNSGTTAQTLANPSLTANTGSTITLDPNGGGGTTLTLGNTWTRGAGASLFIDLSAGGTLSSTPAVVSSILGYAVVKDATGTGIATVSGGSVVRLTTFTALPTGGAGNAGVNYSLSGNLTRTALFSVSSLSIDTTGGGTLDLGGYTCTLANGTYKPLIFTGTGNYVITNGTIESGASQIMDLHQYSEGVVTIAAVTSSSGNKNMTKAGPGTLVIANKSGTGAINITGGALRADNANVLDAEYVTVCGGGVVELTANSGNFTKALGASGNSIQWLGDGGFSAYGTAASVQIGGSSASIVWGSTYFVGANNALVLSSTHSDSTIDFQNGLDFACGQRVVSVYNGSAAVDARLSGVLSGRYGGGLIKRGAGTLELTGANTYQGDTWVEEGAVKVSGTSGTGLVTVNSGASISGTGTVNRLTLNSGGKLLVADATKPLNVTGTMNISNGTLDLAGLGTLPDGDVAIVNCGAVTGSSFGSVLNLPAGREVEIVGSTISLKDTTAQGFMLIVR